MLRALSEPFNPLSVSAIVFWQASPEVDARTFLYIMCFKAMISPPWPVTSLTIRQPNWPAVSERITKAALQLYNLVDCHLMRFHSRRFSTACRLWCHCWH